MKKIKTFKQFVNEQNSIFTINYRLKSIKNKFDVAAISSALGEKDLSKIYITSDMGDDDPDIFEKVHKAFTQSSSKSLVIASTEEGGELRYDKKSNIVMEVGLAGTGYFYTKKSKI